MSLTSRRTVMARKRYKPEEIVAKLRQVDVLVSQGQNMVDAIRQIGVSEVTYYRWRQEFGGLKTEQVKRLKDLELENSRRWPRVWTQSRNSVSVRPGAGHASRDLCSSAETTNCGRKPVERCKLGHLRKEVAVAQSTIKY